MKTFIRTRLAPLWLRAGGSKAAVFAADLMVLAFAVYLSFALRLTLFIPPAFRPDMASAWLGFALSVGAVFSACGVYRIHWPQASLEEYALLGRSYALAAFLFVLLERFLPALFVPRSSLAILILAGFIAVAFLRVSWRLALASVRCEPQREKNDEAFIIGAGEAGTLLARDLLRSGHSLRPLAFFDDDESKQGKTIATLPVLGTVADLPAQAARLGVRQIIIALPSQPGRRIREILALLSQGAYQVRVIPGLKDLAGGKVSISSLRKIDLEDLLRREPICLDDEGIRSVVEGCTVLVTGAGGSIGSEICRQIVQYGPERLLVAGHGEHSIYTVLEEFREKQVPLPLVPLIVDVADGAAMERLFAAYRPRTVFHAAAHKHVPLMEGNAAEALRVNVLGTATVARLAGRYGADRMVMISTDKAVNPTSVMGATKRLAEMALEETQEAFPATAYMAVRFGNVLGSRGSVIPKFERQIERGGPVTVTDPEMRRYFMLIPEAVSLVLQASALGRGGELFVLDMGEPVRIVELAEMLISLHGREPYRDVEIVFSGIRPGEKLFEELFYDPDRVSRTAHDKIFQSRLDRRQTKPLLAQLAQAFAEGIDDDGARALLARFVPSFSGRQASSPRDGKKQEALSEPAGGGL